LRSEGRQLRETGQLRLLVSVLSEYARFLAIN